MNADVLPIRPDGFDSYGRRPLGRRGRRPGARLATPSGVADLLAAAGAADLPCWSYDPDLFFAESPAEIEQAKAVCRECLARQQCLAGALERREPWGVWGGEYVADGVVVAEKRRRGRPRKQPIAA
jgi:WhiB family redox-sensing transcriptional regulator